MEAEQLTQLIKIISASNLTEFQYEEENMKLIIKKEGTTQIAEPILENKGGPKKEDRSDVSADVGEDNLEGNVVVSPLVGTFYSVPAEDAMPFVQVGEVVRKGQTIAIVEAMKLMNDIECEFDGTVKEIFVKNGQTVEYGQPLFLIG